MHIHGQLIVLKPTLPAGAPPLNEQVPPIDTLPDDPPAKLVALLPAMA